MVGAPGDGLIEDLLLFGSFGRKVHLEDLQEESLAGVKPMSRLPFFLEGQTAGRAC